MSPEVEVVGQDALPLEGLDTEEFSVVADAILHAIDEALDAVIAPSYLSSRAQERFMEVLDEAVVDIDIHWGGEHDDD